MTTYFLIVLETISIMFVLLLVGAFLYKQTFISNETVNQLSNVLLKVASPALVISSFLREFSARDAKLLGETFLFVLIAVGISFIFSNILFKKNILHWQEKKLGVIFTNNAFIAFPLLSVLFGSMGIFLGSVYFSVSSTLLWIYGINVVDEKRKFNYKNIVFNPSFIGVVLGLIFFFTSTTLPTVLSAPLALIGGLNTPLSMFILGAHLAKSNIKDILKDINLLVYSISIMLVLPAIIMVVFLLLPTKSNMALTVVLVGAACPAGATLSMLFDISHKDPSYMSRIVSVTTILSLITLPIILTAFQFFVSL